MAAWIPWLIALFTTLVTLGLGVVAAVQKSTASRIAAEAVESNSDASREGNLLKELELLQASVRLAREETKAAQIENGALRERLNIMQSKNELLETRCTELQAKLWQVTQQKGQAP